MVWSERNLFPFCAWMDSDFNSKGFSRQEKVARTWAPRLGGLRNLARYSPRCPREASETDDVRGLDMEDQVWWC